MPGPIPDAGFDIPDTSMPGIGAVTQLLPNLKIRSNKKKRKIRDVSKYDFL